MVEVAASWARDEENAYTFLGNYRFSLFIYYSYAISPDNNIICIYIMDFICV